MCKQGGFSLVELITVMVVLGILSAVALPRVMDNRAFIGAAFNADVVSALPADLLQHQDQTALDIDAPEFTQFPKLFDDSNKDAIPRSTAVLEETVAIVQPRAPEPAVTAGSFESTSQEPVR